ncbi:MAG: FISUMP domain-containing protein [Candidatus Cyclobacteriaceae bacterium M3_2C_046]
MKSYFKIFLTFLFVLSISWACEDEVTQIEPVEIDFEVNDVSSFGGNDGSIDITVKGGAPPYRYFWSNGEVSEDLSNLSAGTYTVNIVYANAGVAEAEITVTEPAPNPLDIAFDVKPVSSYASADGVITVEVSGGVPPYQYQWSHGATGKKLEQLLPGEFTVTVTDSNPYLTVSTTKSVELIRPSFTCGEDSVRDVDGNKYPTVQIGNQCWTAENLRVIHTPESTADNMIKIEGRYCFGANCSGQEGAHYSWQAMMNGASAAESGDQVIQGVCPDGWHVPTLVMWQEMENLLKIAGNGGAGTNVPVKIMGNNSSSGFDGVYAEAWGYDPIPSDQYAAWWTANEFVPSNASDDFNSTNAYYRGVNANLLSIFQRGNTAKSVGLSVRCIKD